MKKLSIFLTLFLFANTVYAATSYKLIKTEKAGQTLNVTVEISSDGYVETLTRPVWITAATDKAYVIGSLENIAAEVKARKLAIDRLNIIKPAIDAEIGKTTATG